MSPAVQQIAADAQAAAHAVAIAEDMVSFEADLRRSSFIDVDTLTERLAVHPDGAKHAAWLSEHLSRVIDFALGLQGEGA